MKKKTAVVTIASENYYAQVKTLLDSLKTSNEDWDRFFAVVDNPDKDLKTSLKQSDVKLLQIDELGISDVNDMKFRYDIMELNTAIKPYVLLKLLKEYDRAVYLDPDIYVYEKMNAINSAFDEGYHIVITPHFSDYFFDDNKHPDEIDILKSGIYNLGFIAVDNSEESISLLSWWAKKLEKLCINKQNDGIFVDQKWIDFVPSRHEKTYILRNSGYNVAYWNLSHRFPSKKNNKYFFNDEPLVFYHFSGFDPLEKNVVSKYQNRFTMNQIGVAKELFVKYSDIVISNDYSKWKQKKYTFENFDDGRKIKKIFRLLYREEEKIEKKIKDKNPFTCGDFFYNDADLSPYLVEYALNEHNHSSYYFIFSSWKSRIEWFADVFANEYDLDEVIVSKAIKYLYIVLSANNGQADVMNSQLNNSDSSETFDFDEICLHDLKNYNKSRKKWEIKTKLLYNNLSLNPYKRKVQRLCRKLYLIFK